MNTKFIEVKFQELKNEVSTFIKSTYNKSANRLSAADPYGHLLQVVEMIFSSTMLYIKNVLTQFDINNPNNNNAKMVNALARVGGHNPGRAVSATGVLSLQLRPGVNIIEEIPGGEIIVQNGLQLSNKTNNLPYFIDFGGIEQSTFQLEHSKKYFLSIVQGTIETQTFTGTGGKNQSFTVNVPARQSVEQFRVTVKVNGQVYTSKDNIRDMLPDERSFVMRTGISSGIDLYFGTGNFGAIPAIGSSIEVTYVVSDGSLGNLPSLNVNDWVFTDDIYDSFGTTVEAEELFNVFIENEITLGGDKESVRFTKSVLPYVSRNFVLARPENFQFQLSRLNIFSQIDAFTTQPGSLQDNNNPDDDSVVYIFLIPKISQFTKSDATYFNLNINAFTLDEYEKNKLQSYLRSQGTITLSTTVKILDPEVLKYVVNLFLIVYDDAIEDNIRSEIFSQLSNYFFSLKRDGRIPKSDIIRIIEDVPGVSSVDVEFISEDNEAYHLEFEKYKESILRGNPNANPDLITKEGYEPDRVIGLDPDFGDIIYNKRQLPIIRGGWRTREEVLYKETPTNKGLGSVNISIRERIKRQIFS